MWLSARSARAAPARLPPDHARGRARLPELGELGVGLLHVFIRHTSASLTLNENASPDVRDDFGAFFDDAVPEDAPYWTHTIEGPTTCPRTSRPRCSAVAHAPGLRGRLALGTWQGIYLCEHRDRGGSRSLVATLHGR
jgi:secondary thiamine-phosphate synthase enzyme